jgi:hypothetical protein
MSKTALLQGAPDFMGGMQVLKYLPVKVSEYLHNVHGDKFSSLGLPPRDSCRGLTLLEIEQLFERIEFVGADSTVIVLYGGVTIGNSEYEGLQRVYAWPFPHKKFRGYNLRIR